MGDGTIMPPASKRAKRTPTRATKDLLTALDENLLMYIMYFIYGTLHQAPEYRLMRMGMHASVCAEFRSHAHRAARVAFALPNSCHTPFREVHVLLGACPARPRSYEGYCIDGHYLCDYHSDSGSATCTCTYHRRAACCLECDHPKIDERTGKPCAHSDILCPCGWRRRIEWDNQIQVCDDCGHAVEDERAPCWETCRCDLMCWICKFRAVRGVTRRVGRMESMTRGEDVSDDEDVRDDGHWASSDMTEGCEECLSYVYASNEKPPRGVDLDPAHPNPGYTDGGVSQGGYSGSENESDCDRHAEYSMNAVAARYLAM